MTISDALHRLLLDNLTTATILLDAGQEVPEFADCDVAALIDSVVRDFEAAAAAKHQRLEVVVTPAACALVVDDATASSRAAASSLPE